MWYKNAGTTFFRFVTNHAFDITDRQTDRQILITRPRLPGEPKKIPPTTFVDITAMHRNFRTKFYTIVKRSNIHFITKFY